MIKRNHDILINMTGDLENSKKNKLLYTKTYEYTMYKYLVAVA